MKTLELEQMGVREMDAVEMKETDGGIIGVDDLIIAGVFLVGAILGFFASKKAVTT